jgi:hypothetical protein
LYELDNKNLVWRANKVTGVNYVGPGDKIYDITGKNNFIILNNGKINFNNYLNTNQTTGSLLLPVIKSNSNLFINSGSGFASENNSFARRAFTGDRYYYLLDNTGEIGFYFNNYGLDNKAKITHYSFELDYNALKYPYIFDLQISNDKNIWFTIDSRTGNDLLIKDDPLNFYNYPKEIVIECKNSDQLMNTNQFYEYARLHVRSGKNWPHNFVGDRSSNGIGLRTLQFYNRIPVSIDNSLPVSSRHELIPNLINYNTTLDNTIENKSFIGEVIYSNDSNGYPAWYAFNNNKSLYPYAEIYKNNSNSSFLGYKTINNNYILTGFYIEFEPNFKPKVLKVEASADNQNYITVYEKLSNIQNIESGNFSLIEGYSNVRFNFASSLTCDANIPITVDIDNDCYQRVVEFDTHCCNIEWDNVCQSLYSLCNNNCPAPCGGGGSSSSSSSQYFGKTESMWIGTYAPFVSSTGCCNNLVCVSGVVDCESCICTPSGATGCSGTGCLPPPPPVEIDCSGVPIEIKGYAFYRDRVTTPCNVPGIGNVTASCAGGHACNRTFFMPQLVFSNGTTINADKQINVNNSPMGGDRDDSFVFTIPDSTIVSGNKVNFVLDCQSPLGNCHKGVTFVVLTMDLGGATKSIFNSCVAPNELNNIPFICSGVGCSSSKFNPYYLSEWPSEDKHFIIKVCPDIPKPFPGANRHPACLRWVCACFSGSNGLSDLVESKQIGGPTVNNLDLTGIVWNYAPIPTGAGCYIYEFEFYGWQSDSPNSQWQSADDCFDLYNLKPTGNINI